MDNSKFDKEDLFERTSIPKAVAQLSVPTIIGSLVMMLYNLADTYFVGMLDDPVQNAAVTLAAPVLLAFNAINNLFGVGCSSMMSRALGKKDYDTVSGSSTFGFWCSIVCGLIFSVGCTVLKGPLLTLLGADKNTFDVTDGYMFWTVTCGAIPSILNMVMSYFVRSEGESLHASIGSMSGCILNMILDPLFILPQFLGMGSAGAGCATFISNCVACAYFFVLIYVKRNKSYVCIDPRKLTINARIAKEVFGVGVPASIQNLLNVTGMTVLNNFAAEYGADAVAAIGIAQKISMIPMYAAMGLSQGVMPLISYNYASGNSSRMKKTISFTGWISFAFLVAVSVMYYVGAESLIGAFINNPGVIGYGTGLLRGLCLGTPFLAVDFLAVGVFQACGMGINSLVFAIARKIVLEIPALFVLNAVFGLYGLAYAQFCAEFVLTICALIFLHRIFVKLRCVEEPG